MFGTILISAPLELLSLYPWTIAGAAASPREPLLPLVWGTCRGLALAVIACWRSQPEIRCDGRKAHTKTSHFDQAFMAGDLGAT
jgi:hypothetical protein